MLPLSWLLVTASAATSPPPLDPVVVIQQGKAVCAGSVVDAEGHVLTAYHCIARGGRPLVTRHDGVRGVGRVVVADPGRDLAVVLVEALAGGPMVEVATSPPAPGGEVWAIGHPYASVEPGGYLEGTLRFAVSWGHVAAAGPYTLQITAPVNPGNSGGPVFDAEGRQVGVVSRRLQGDGLGFASHASDGLALLQRARRPSVVGGTLELEIDASSWGGSGGGLGVGGRLGLLFRDRVHLMVGGAAPLSARWDSVARGRASWMAANARIGLRQRFFRGPLTAHIELEGGVGAIGVMLGDEDMTVRQDVFFAPLAGVRVGIAGVALEGGAALDADGSWVTWGQLVWTWPGTLSYF